MTCKPRKQFVIVFNYVRTWSNYVWQPQRSSESLQFFIVSSVAKDCLVLSQYDLHHGTITHCKSTSLRWRAVLSKLVQRKENSQEKKIVIIGHGQMNNIGKSRGQD